MRKLVELVAELRAEVAELRSQQATHDLQMLWNCIADRDERICVLETEVEEVNAYHTFIFNQWGAQKESLEAELEKYKEIDAESIRQCKLYFDNQDRIDFSTPDGFFKLWEWGRKQEWIKEFMEQYCKESELLA